MRDAGEMHDGVDIADEGPPFDGTGEIGHRHHLHRARKNIGGRPHGGAHAVPLRRKLVDERAPDEARGTGDQDAHQGFPRANRSNSQPTNTAPAMSAASEAMRLALATAMSASATSARLTANTRAMISGTVKPPSMAR